MTVCLLKCDLFSDRSENARKMPWSGRDHDNLLFVTALTIEYGLCLYSVLSFNEQQTKRSMHKQISIQTINSTHQLESSTNKQTNQTSKMKSKAGNGNLGIFTNCKLSQQPIQLYANTVPYAERNTTRMAANSFLCWSSTKPIQLWLSNLSRSRQHTLV